MKNKRKSKRGIIISVILIGIVALAGIRMIRRPRASNTTEVTPSKGDITTYYSFTGSIEAKNRDTVLADRMMQIDEIMVEEGDEVKKDDILLKTASGQKIRADINGEVSKIHVEENAQVVAGAQLVEIVDYSNLQLRVKVDEYDLSAIIKDKEASVTIHALGREVKGRVVEVSREGTHSNGITFFEAVISLEKDEAVMVGMSAEARMVNQSVKDVVTLPMSVIQFDDANKPYVTVKGEGGQGVRRDLTLGINDGINVEVKEGITTSDRVLVPSKEVGPQFGPGRMREDDGDRKDSTGGNR